MYPNSFFSEGMSLTDLLSGIQCITHNGFPLESLPAQGVITVTFNTGTVINIRGNEAEYHAAVESGITDGGYKPFKLQEN